MANQTFAIDSSPVQLRRFAIPGQAGLLGPGLSAVCDMPAEAEPGFAIEGLLDGQWREVKVARSPSGHRILISGVGEFTVSADGCAISSHNWEAGILPDTVIEALLGPPVMMALALRGVWCLHASAVIVDGAGVAFMCDSGGGKSTLASFFDAECGPLVERMSDDILPVESGPDRIMALPHFPQLKLPPSEQVPMGTPERIPLAAIYTLNPSSSRDEGEVNILPLSSRQATVALLRHTVASRLFPPPLLERHLDFCAAAGHRVPVRRLSYPRRREWLPPVCDALLADLKALGLLPGCSAKGRLKHAASQGLRFPEGR
jgi:hypothetical protein